MDPVTGALIGTGVSAIAGFLGGERANDRNSREAQRNRDFQAGEARTNRDFQERMRNTEWQAAVEDMRRAGVNPALAYARGGASSPGGSMASGSQAAPSHDSVSSAMQGVRLANETRMMKESIRKVSAEAETAEQLAVREKARNLGYGISERDGQMQVDYSLPGLVQLTQAEVRERVANAARAGSMASIAGIGGQVAGSFQEFMPALGRISRVAGQGADQLAGVVELLEKAARMRDSAVRAWLGMPKAAAVRLLDSIRRARN